jgi:hypothetical protein
LEAERATVEKHLHHWRFGRSHRIHEKLLHSWQPEQPVAGRVLLPLTRRER